MKYIFYDTETSGLTSEFDQILQFAALEVDENLNEINSINIKCRPLHYIVPSPTALVVTKVRPSELLSRQHSHLEMVYQMRNWISQRSPSLLIGHNSIGFDENFVRQAFYKTLHPVYLTNTSGNSRADTMKIAHAVSIYMPGRINVPIKDNGKETFNLGDLVRANGISFDDSAAHDALADVRATLQLARLLKNVAPEIWNQMHINAYKNSARDFIWKNDVFCSSEVNFGNKRTNVVTGIAMNPKYDAEVAVFDLTFNPTDYINCSVEELVELFNAKEKSIRIIKINAQPIMVDKNIGQPFINTLQLDQKLLDQRVQQIRSAEDFQRNVALALTMRYGEEEPSPHVEKAIFQGFPSRQDENLMSQIHQTDWQAKANLCNNFTNDKYKTLGLRLVYSEKPEHLPESARIDLDRHFKECLLTDDAETPWLTIPKALKELSELSGRTTQEHLAEIESFIHDIRKRFEAA